MRKWLAVAGLLAMTATFVMGQSNDRVGMTAHYTELFRENRVLEFVRQPDTTCACLSDTTTGPSIRIFGARRVIWRIQANSGTCSLVTVQVSNNDSTWVSAPNAYTSMITTFAVGDSFNTGGVQFVLFPSDSARIGAGVMPWRFSRVIVRQRAGVTSNNNCTALCRAKVDSLRFKAYVQWTQP